MATPKYPTAPVATQGLPPGIPFIIVNEAAERFNFYGMRAILVVFMTHYLMGKSGALATMREEEARTIYHLFVSAAYFFPLLGGILSDAFLGKYRTIFWLSLVYCIGSFALAMDTTRVGLMVGLVLIALGSGGIKPCVSSLVGDQFGEANQHLMSRVFGWFYFSINVGSSVSSLLTPWLLEKYGPRIAFGVPGVFMLLATVVFVLGRYRFVRIPASGPAFVKETFSMEGLGSIGRVAAIFALVAMFWALYDQTGSSWVTQAAHLNCTWLGFNWIPSQMQAANPFLILIFIPLFSYVIYPAMNKVWTLTPLRKIGIGMFLMVPTFLIPMWLEQQIAQGLHPSIGWQFLDYIILTAAEIMVSITSLEFAYTQAPKKMKSLIMSLYLLSMSLGNAFTAMINYFIQNPDGTSKLAGASYFQFFSILMFVTAVLFSVYALFYRGKTYLQDEVSAA